MRGMDRAWPIEWGHASHRSARRASASSSVTRNLQVSGVGAIPDMPASGDQHGERFPIHRFHDETRVDRRLGL